MLFPGKRVGAATIERQCRSSAREAPKVDRPRKVLPDGPREVLPYAPRKGATTRRRAVADHRIA